MRGITGLLAGVSMMALLPGADRDCPGSSPRGLQSLIRGARIWAAVRGATNVSTDDIIRIAKVALRHRIILNFEGEAQQVKVDDVIDKLLVQVKTPAQLAM